MKYDALALGELLIDFTQNGISTQGNFLFEANPGGAPCNVLAMLSKLGHKTAFIGKVGDDSFGHMLADVIAQEGIDTRYLCCDPSVHTTLALVHNQADGERDFSFYRNPGADMMLTAQEVQEEPFANTRIFHFGSLSMTDDGVFEATKKAIGWAEKHCVLRSFDPNLRPPLWTDLELAKERIRYGLAHCDILKISDSEIQWLTGEMDYSSGVEAIRADFDIPLILVSMGREGSRAYTSNSMVEVPAFLTDKTIETTGAGDAFCASVLHGVLQHGMDTLSDPQLREILCFANAAASIVTTRKGALRVMPTHEEILRQCKPS